MPNALTTEAGNVVAFEGEARASWTRQGDEWRFDGVWPKVIELNRLRAQIKLGARLLVVLPLTDSPATALGSELGMDDAVVEIPISPLDWLPSLARRRGLAFRRSTIASLLLTPALLRPPVVVDTADREVRFAVRVSRSPEIADRAFATLADHLFAARRSRLSTVGRLSFGTRRDPVRS